MSKIKTSVLIISSLLLFSLAAALTVKAVVSYSFLRQLSDRQTFRIECPGGQLSLTKSRLPNGQVDQSVISGICSRLAQAITPVPTRPSVPSPTPVVAPTSAPAHVGASSIAWHAPGTHDGLNAHEHGDAPPDWASGFSRDNFGHGVVFGGDEATPNENAMKHQAYKGFLIRVKSQDVYVRYHAASNPMDRMVPFHSYEVYLRDSSGGVSFWQGWYFVSYPDDPNGRRPRHNESGRNSSFIGYVDQTDWDRHLRCEQWYGTAGAWSWDMGITICGATTLSSPDEYLAGRKDYYMDMSHWILTGDMGLERRIEVSWYGPSNPYAANRGNPPLGKWFCTTRTPTTDRRSPIQAITIRDAGGPAGCPAGTLPQFISPTVDPQGVYFEQGNSLQKVFPGRGIVTVPN